MSLSAAHSPRTLGANLLSNRIYGHLGRVFGAAVRRMRERGGTARTATVDNVYKREYFRVIEESLEGEGL